MSFFQRDLSKEQILSVYLDTIYDQLSLPFKRVKDLDLQFKGVDLIYDYNGRNIYIDEKAQLDYLNSDLPTFTFELSYLKAGKLKTGWFLDSKKISHYYFLVTSLHVHDINDLSKGVSKCKITSVNRHELNKFLHQIGLSFDKLTSYDDSIRKKGKPNKKTEINELYANSQGCLVYSNHLDEKPINLMLKLNFLIEQGIAKRIYPRPKSLTL